MKLLTFLARRFAWTPHVAFDAAAVDQAPRGDAREECVVVFVHAQPGDELPERRASLTSQARKHVEWLARKRGTRSCVLHSFTHLDGASAPPEFARAWIDELAERLTARGFDVARTPFGWSCAWDLSVHGESVAKVWKQLGLSQGEPAEEI